MKELVICSGKGGTGKTSMAAALATLAENRVLADCDVDAADLHLVVGPENTKEEVFQGGYVAEIQPELCAACGSCRDLCQFGAIDRFVTGDGEERFEVTPVKCEGCGVCVHFCPAEAIAFPRATNGSQFVSDTRHGPMVHARLFPGQENSGKLVTKVRQKARALAAEKQSDLILTDGPPGIGCPVTASITGADLVLAVTEPGVSGKHDLDRLIQLAEHFEVPVAVCINKADINPEFASHIETECWAAGVPVVGRVPFDQAITEAQLEGKSVAEMGSTPASQAIKDIWKKTLILLDQKTKGKQE